MPWPVTIHDSRAHFKADMSDPDIAELQDVRAYRVAEATHGRELDRHVVWDHTKQREQISS